MNYSGIGQTILNLSQVGSTNDYASFLLSAGEAVDGMVVNAFEQTSGRGQRGRVWYAVPGESITFSLILKDCKLRAERAFLLQILSALSIRRWASEFVPENDLRLKWPNDVMFGERKFAGILTETQIQGGLVSAAIIGMGINLNQENFPSGNGNPVSLFMISGKYTRAEEQLKLVCRKLREVFGEWAEGREAALISEYEQYFFGLGQWRTFRFEGVSVECMPLGINENGALMLRNRDGSIRTVDSALPEWH